MDLGQEIDRTCLAYNLADEILSKIEDVFKDIRQDYLDEYTAAKEAYYAEEKKQKREG